MAATFKLWQDQAMTIPLSTINGIPSIQLQYDGSETLISNVWFGSPNAGRVLEPQASNPSGNIILSVSENPQVWQASTSVTSGDIVQANGFMYRALRSGLTAEAIPAFPLVVGHSVNDGTTRWTNIGQAFDESNIRLALSESEAATTVASSLNLGNSISGGTAIAVWFKAVNTDDTPRSDSTDPIVVLNINKVIEKAA